MTTAAMTAAGGVLDQSVRTGDRPPLWQLPARPDRIVALAQHWRDLAGAAEATAQRIADGTAELSAGWTGASAQAYQAHRNRLLDAFTTVSTVSGQVADTVIAAADTVSTAQDHLDDSWARLVRAAPLTEVAPGRLLYTGGTVSAAAIAAAGAEARDIRAHADSRLTGLAADLHGLRLQFGPPTLLLRYDEHQPWPTPDERTAPAAVILDGDRVIVDATGGDDAVWIGTDPRTGELLVRVDHTLRRFPADTDLVLRTGSGDDRVTITDDARARITVLAGPGDDTVQGGPGDESILGLAGHDTVQAGGGSDYVSGGAGPDYLDGQSGDDLLAGGTGDDTLYGLDGADRLWGGAGADYADGGAGADLLAGGGDDDALFGGRDADTVLGGSGDDRLYGGDGADQLNGGTGADRAFAQPGDTVTAVDDQVEVPITGAGGFIRIAGTADFQARVESDLDALRSSPDGELMLTTLQHQHDAGSSVPLIGHHDADTLVIQRTEVANGIESPGFSRILPANHDRVEYNPTFSTFGQSPPVPPVVVLYHELAHVEDQFAGTKTPGTFTGPDNPGVPNDEREAVGLPIDDDGDPSTPDRLDPVHPFPLTENGLRAELGLAPRVRY